MAEKLRIGVIGSGFAAHFHLASYRKVYGEAFEVSALCSRNRPQAVALAQAFSVPRIVDDIDAMLADPAIQIVTIGTPSGAHMEPAVAAAKAGKHVIVEKPLEITLDRCDKIINACKENGVSCGAILPSRFSPANIALKKVINDGRFGKLTLGDTYVKWWRTQEYYDSGAWRGTWELDGGGCLMNQSIHAIDLMLHFGGAPAEVFGYTATRTHARLEVEDNACAVVRFASGALGVIESSTSCAPGFAQQIEIAGERGTAVIEGDAIVRWQFADADPIDGPITAAMGPSRLGSGASDPKGISIEGHRRQIEDMVGAVREGRGPAVDGTQARLPVELVCGIYESMRTGRPYRFAGA